MKYKILESKYFRIKSNVYIDEGTMNLVALFFGLFGAWKELLNRISLF